MGNFSIWHWTILLIAILGIVVPYGKLWARTGHSPFWAILIFVPFVNWISLWVLAFKKWPIDSKQL